PPSVEINFQLNNDGSQTVTFDPHTIQLSDAGLTRFDPPIVRPEQPPITLDPAQSTTITAYFPFPPGRTADNMEMSSLQLRWNVHIGDRSVSQTVFFRQSSPTYYYYRPYYYYDDPYWYGGPYWYGPSVFVGPRVFIGPRFHHRRW
ncbi:MAG TPA: hypothetical protein VLI90_06485, partial [Tepidisphaeraceae bacterium]|nr:hypothetical protein [Tepidisphaeraceae bacterium]